MFKNLNLGALGFKVSFFETIESANLGRFQGVDPDVLEMKEILKTKSAKEIGSLVEGKNLRLGGWGLPVDFKGDEETFREGLRRLPSLAQLARELECSRVYTWITPFSDTLPFKENFELHVNRLSSVAQILKDHECVLGLEFVAPKTSRANHKYEFIHTMDGILRLREAIKTDNAGLLLDSWHWYTSRGTLDQLRRLKRKDVIYVHVSDAPAGIPVDEQIDNVRRLPGETRVINIAGFLKTLKEIGYDGPVTPEPFERELREMPFREAVKKAGTALDNIWKLSGL